LVRLVVRDDANQVRAAEEFIGTGAWVSQLVLAETTWVLDAVYERSADQIATALDVLLNHEPLSMQDADVVSAATENFRERPALRSSNCLMLELVRKAGHLPLGTFERNLAKLEGAERLRQ
jgi:predicted nucleic-acid-binding protein